MFKRQLINVEIKVQQEDYFKIKKMVTLLEGRKNPMTIDSRNEDFMIIKIKESKKTIKRLELDLLVAKEFGVEVELRIKN
jgi:hypothetical protein